MDKAFLTGEYFGCMFLLNQNKNASDLIKKRYAGSIKKISEIGLKLKEEDIEDYNIVQLYSYIEHIHDYNHDFTGKIRQSFMWGICSPVLETTGNKQRFEHSKELFIEKAESLGMKKDQYDNLISLLMNKDMNNFNNIMMDFLQNVV
jgi:hypothetical protein